MIQDTIPGALRSVNAYMPRGEVLGVRIVEKPGVLSCALRRCWQVVTTAGCDRSRKVRPIDFFYTERDCLQGLRTIASFLER